MKKSSYEGTYASLSDVGLVRKTNEDQTKCVVNSQKNVLLVVADGMGGHKRGDLASFKVVEELNKEFIKKDHFNTIFDVHFWLGNTLKKINKNIYNLSFSKEEYKGMGSTVCLCLIYKNKLVILNAGDSRCYALKNGNLIQLTEDQTYVRYLVNSGIISEEEALTHPKKNILTNAIGLFPTFSYDLNVYDYEGETLLLCSDGLYNNVSFKELEINLKTEASVEEKVKSLINLANFNGGTDNISCIIWEAFND